MSVVMNSKSGLVDGNYGIFTVISGVAALNPALGVNGDVMAKDAGAWTAVNQLPTVPGLIKGNVTDGTYTIVLKLRRAVTVVALTSDLVTGTCTLAVTIDGVNVGGLSGISQSTTEITTSATSANSASIGQSLAIVVTSAAGATDLSFQIELNYV